MKRKTIQLAKNTLVVSLPRKWVKEYQVQKGQEIDIDQQGNRLVISTENTTHPKTIDIDLKGYTHASHLWYVMSMLYRSGYEEITLHFSHDTVETKNKQKKKITDQIAQITEKFIGMEVMRFGKHSCVLKEVSRPKPEEFSALWNRIFHTVLDMCHDLSHATTGEDFRRIAEYTEDSVNKMTNFAIRILHQQSPYDIQGTMRMLHLLQRLEEIADVFAAFAREQKQPQKLSDVHALLRLLYTYLQKPKRDLFRVLHTKKLHLQTDPSLSPLADMIMQSAAWVVPQ